MAIEMFKSVHLTSPEQHGDNVAEAQYLLRSNRWDQKFYTGELDGVYGPESAAATRRAKWYLGYPEKKCHGSVGAGFGAEIRSYLITSKHSAYQHLPLLYQRRKKQRLVVLNNWHNQAISEALKYLDYKENPFGSNMTMFNRWFYGSNVAAPWCAIFASYVINHCDGPTWFKYSYVPDIVDLARTGAHGMAFTSAPGPAAVVCYDWNGDGVADHAELFDRWVSKAAGTFYAVGGNTGPVDQSNGGEVLRQQRYLSNVQHFVHVPNK